MKLIRQDFRIELVVTYKDIERLHMKWFLFYQDGQAKLCKTDQAVRKGLDEKLIIFSVLTMQHTWRWVHSNQLHYIFQVWKLQNFKTNSISGTRYTNMSEKQILFPIPIFFIYIIWLSRASILNFTSSIVISIFLSSFRIRVLNRSRGRGDC